MSAEKLLYATLSAAAELKALVADRIFPGKLPQDCEVPAVVYSRSGNAPVQSIAGDTSGLDQVRLRVACHALDYSVAKSVADQVRLAMRALESSIASDVDLYDDLTQTHTVALDFYLWDVPV